jgi:hypothetical protein
MTAQSHPGGRHGAPGPLCGARTRSGTACTQPPAPGSTRCRYHGGHSCRGAASGTWKHGRYSKYLPTGLADRYRDLLRDPELLAANDEVALLATRLGELVGRLNTGESGELWHEIVAGVANAAGTCSEMRAALLRGDDAAFTQAMDRLRTLLDGLADVGRRAEAAEDTWAEIRKVVEEKTKAASREWKRLVDLQGLVSADQAMALVLAMSQSVNRHVRDAGARQAIAYDLSLFITSARAGQAPPPVALPGPPADPGPSEPGNPEA